MKHERHNAIKDLVRSQPILNQDDLRRKLLKRGFDVTQATLSRDIHELHLYKGPNGYSLGNGGTAVLDEDEDLPAIDEILSSFGLRAKNAANQVILITTMGGAQPTAAAIDAEEWPEVLGTIAGDDTVLIICPDAKQAITLRERLEEMIG